jgi:hypothetical protein
MKIRQLFSPRNKKTTFSGAVTLQYQAEIIEESSTNQGRRLFQKSHKSPLQNKKPLPRPIDRDRGFSVDNYFESMVSSPVQSPKCQYPGSKHQNIPLPSKFPSFLFDLFLVLLQGFVGLR